METSIGELICYYRKEKGMSQEELGGMFCTRKTIFNIEKGASQPSLEIIGYLSERLGVNLVDAYCSVSKHNDLYTHIKFLKLSRELKTFESREDLLKLIEEYEAEEGFKEGEPRQLICYARAILYVGEQDYENACEIALEGIKISYPDFPDWKARMSIPSNIVSALLLTYAVNLCRMGKTEEGVQALIKIEEEVKKLLLEDYGEMEDRQSFWINLWCSSIYNEYIFSDAISSDFVEKLDEAIEYQKRNKRVHMMTELLLCKAVICMEKEKGMDFLDYYNSAKTIGELFFSDEYFEKVSKKINGKRSKIDFFE